MFVQGRRRGIYFPKISTIEVRLRSEDDIPNRKVRSSWPVLERLGELDQHAPHAPTVPDQGADQSEKDAVELMSVDPAIDRIAEPG